MPERLRVLLDEHVDRQITALFAPELEVYTVPEMGWEGLRNGELLRAASAEFDVFVTMDRNLPYQQNLSVVNLAVVVVRATSNAFTDVAPLMAKINEAVRQLGRGRLLRSRASTPLRPTAGRLRHIDAGRFLSKNNQQHPPRFRD